ncbi:MAG: putative maltokinase, partial [Rhodocyclaceae bacterium]|nr:putative maltokinase [Rhodocyclaceae bacterium]
LCVANLSRSAQPVELDLAACKGRTPVELLGRAAFPPIGDAPYVVTLPGHGFFWFHLAKGDHAPDWHVETLVREEIPVLVFFDGWHSLFRDRVVPWRIGMAERVRQQFERDALPRFLAGQRWFAAKGEKPALAALRDQTEWGERGGNFMLALFEVPGAAGPADYFIPLSMVWEDDEARSRALRPAGVARVRQQARLGVLGDACADEEFVRSLVAAIGGGREWRCAHGSIRCRPGSNFARLAGADPAALAVRPMVALSSNTTVAVGDSLFLKVYRRLQAGIGPEIEVGRFLSEVAHFGHSVPVAGTVEYQAADGSVTALALLQGYVPNQGDGWTYTVDYLERAFERVLAASAEPDAEAHGGYLALIATLGRRTAELHLALATPTGDAAFGCAPLEPGDLVAWAHQIAAEARTSLDKLAAVAPRLPAAVQAAAARLLERRDALLARCAAPLPDQGRAHKIRHHGDYHLGQVLLAQNDFLIIDFEGEPARSLAERRKKHSPLRDLAGMLRSFDYAARWSLQRVARGRDKE